MHSIRVRNLRSFSDCSDDVQPYVDLKHLNVFVGKNSCGKSTLLRSLPILKQSFNPKVRAPILWYGEYTDFGSFKTALHRYATNEKIYFDYKFSIDLSSNSWTQKLTGRPIRKDSIDIEFKQGLCERDGQTCIDTVTLHIDKSKITIKVLSVNEYKILINDKIILDNIEVMNRHSNLTLDFIEADHKSLRYFPFHSLHSNEIIKIYFSALRDIATKKSNIEGFKDKIIGIGTCSFEYYCKIMEKEFKSNKIFYNKWININNEEKYKLYELHLLTFLPDIMKLSSKKLESFAESVKYIGPVRANEGRFSRHQEFDVKEIDPTGINVATFLSRLDQSECKKLACWTKEYFDFTVRTVSDGLHHQVKIKCKNDDEENITDMGSGFVQILPIIISLWNETRDISITDKESKVFAIEQPELHLHPEYQDLLIKTLMTIIKKTKGSINIKVILETHSKTIIDVISDAIEDGEFSHDDTSIYIFNKKNKVTRLSKAEFDIDGGLINWPIGFLSGR